MNADACLRDAKQSVEHPILSADTTHLIRVHYSNQTSTSLLCRQEIHVFTGRCFECSMIDHCVF